tara:strand:+ start:29 stop:451 length:423 start_codon:yes stop_codon:yes gene_type:complete
MDVWIKYALIAAVFIAVRDFLLKNISNKYSYTDYLIYAITISFILIWGYVLTTGYKPKEIKKNDIFIILIRILVVYLIVDPSIFNALKNSSNVGEVSALLNINIVIAFIISIILLKHKVDYKSILGIIFIIVGGCIIGIK